MKESPLIELQAVPTPPGPSEVDDLEPVLPGHYLEIPQRLGILPTRAFWNRGEVWRHGQLFVAPVAGISSIAGFLAARQWFCPVLAGPLVAALLSAASLVFAQGLLERYVRRQLRRRQVDHLALPARR